jgi:hypothetical protein
MRIMRAKALPVVGDYRVAVSMRAYVRVVPEGCFSPQPLTPSALASKKLPWQLCALCAQAPCSASIIR